jgi:enamine deaminase RidA (YjgF/YER057c/UK114 family)
MKQLSSTGSPYEKTLGYSRAVRTGDTVHVSGCSGLLRREAAPEGNASEQFHVAAAKLKDTLEKAGARLQDVVLTRVYLTDAKDWESIGAAHGEVFGDIRPASTMVQVVRLIDEAMLVEIEAVAIIPEPTNLNLAAPQQHEQKRNQ